MKVAERQINYVRNSVDIMVANTGYPVLGKSLNEAGIATRKELRALEKKGHIQSVRLRVGGDGGQQLIAYFTEREFPKAMIREQREQKEEEQPSES